MLNNLVETAYHQNLTLREAAFRILEAQAQLGIATGNFFPQQQEFCFDYSRNAISKNAANRQYAPKQFYNQWDVGFSLSWELDFWGRLRRAIEAADETMEASVEDYDASLVLLISNVAQTYIQVRTLETQIALARENERLQQETLDLALFRRKEGVVSDLDVQQATTNLAQTQSSIPPMIISRRQACNKLCVLMGMPPEEMESRLGNQPIPAVSLDVAVGIPADLLCRRPDIRRAERLLAAQSEQIGISKAELYPQISITGTIGLESERLSNLTNSQSLAGTIGPSLRWNILNYGRLLNAIYYQDSKFRELMAAYQNTVLVANQEVEDGLVAFLYSQDQVRSAAKAVEASRKCVELALDQYRAGKIDFNTVFSLERDLVNQQNLLAQARANIVLGLVKVYEALGGGWQIRCDGAASGQVEGQPASSDEVVMPPEVPSGDRSLKVELPPAKGKSPEVETIRAPMPMPSQKKDSAGKAKEQDSPRSQSP